MSLTIQEQGRGKSDIHISLLVAATLSYNLITLAVNLLTSFFIGSTSIDTVVCLGIYAYFIVRAIPSLFSRASKKDIIFVLAFVLLILVSMLRENNFAAIVGALSIFPRVFLYYFIGRAILNDEHVEKVLFKFAPYVVLVTFVSYFVLAFLTSSQDEDNMSLAYYLLPFTIISAYKMIKQKEYRIISIIVFIGAMFLQIWTGTRGPLLCIFIAMILFVLLNPGRIAPKAIITAILVAGVVLLSSNLFVKWMEELQVYLEGRGATNRIVEKFLEEEFLNSSGRDSLNEKTFAAIGNRMLSGYGLFADRELLGGQYCHNIFLEFIINYGVVIGGAAFIALLVVLFFALRRRKAMPTLFLMLICAGFVKLFVSSSYLIEPMFFMLLGAAFTKPQPDSEVISEVGEANEGL